MDSSFENLSNSGSPRKRLTKKVHYNEDKYRFLDSSEIS